MRPENKSNPDFDESDSLNLIQYVSEKLTSENAPSAIQEIIDYMRTVFSVDCISIREIIPRAYSLKFIFESMDDESRISRLGEVITVDRSEWNSTLGEFMRGCYIFESDSKRIAASFFGPSPNHACTSLHIPMFSGKDFLGTVDLVQFDAPRVWKDSELSALKICSFILCQYLYRLNAFFMSNNNRNEYDPITGLMSYSAFQNRVEEIFRDLLKTSPVVIAYTDIHHFRYINETYGYAKGDELLKLAATTMQSGIKDPASDILISRVHSDNFVSFGPIDEDMIPKYPDFVNEQNLKISKILRQCCPNVQIRINTGICFIRSAKTEAATAIANANLARKLAKENGIRHPLVFEESMMNDIKYQEFLNNELPKAIKNHDLRVYYQPKINCVDDSLYGAEALIRWKQPDGTFIYPDRFIPTFEKNGNIVDVDFYVYREVFAYLRRRIDSGLPVVPISMNVSRVHFKYDRIVPYIKSLLDEYQIPPELIEFELTENIYIKNFTKANEFIRTCKGMKIKVSMDDFGSGYSSLNVMSTLPIDTLKIDRVFLKNAELNESDKTVLECMISMAKRLGMHVICEGVETESQSKFLKDVNCDMIQGYYYGKPMDEESFDKFTKEKLGC